MVFVRRCTTVLLVATLLSLTSILTTTKAEAKELPAKKACPMAQLLLVPQKPCLPKLTKTEEFLSAKSLLSVPKVDEKVEIKVETPVQEVQFVPVETAPTATLSADMLFNMVNAHRSGISMPAMQKDPLVCSVAESRKYEITQEIFSTGNLHAGFYSKNLPYWATENMIWQHTEAEAFTWWLNSPIHRSAIEGDYKYACGTCNGEVCNMVFTNYAPKVASASASVSVVQATTSSPTPPIAQRVTTAVKPIVSVSLPTLR